MKKICKNCGHFEEEHQLVSCFSEVIRDKKGVIIKINKLRPPKDKRGKCLKCIKQKSAVFVCNCGEFKE